MLGNVKGMCGVDFMTEDQWGENVDPLEDLKAAMAKIKEPTPESYYHQIGEMERDLHAAIDLLTKEGKTSEEIIELLIKYGIWGLF
jgi:hypothetical protein